MLRILSMCIIAICLCLPALAVDTVPTAQQRGVVTVVATHGQFYINLGATERIAAGAELLVLRGGCAVGTARVLKVSPLDSVAELLPACGLAVPYPGDTVLVQSSPTGNECRQTSLYRCSQLEALLIPNCTRHRLPDMEPDLDQRGAETFFGLAFLAIGVSALD